MKKAKVFLAAIAVVAIAGSALAVKSQKTVGEFIYLAPNATSPATSLVEATFTDPGIGLQTYASTLPNGVPTYTWTIAAE